jgi:hypothetical protein
VLADRILEEHPPGRQPVDIRGGGALIAIAAHVVAPQGVNADKYNVQGALLATAVDAHRKSRKQQE